MTDDYDAPRQNMPCTITPKEVTMDRTTQDAPRIEDTRLDPDSGATIRIRANSGHTQKLGWTGSDITVEITGPLGPALLAHVETIIRTETLRAHQAVSRACAEMNQREGRV